MSRSCGPFETCPTCTPMTTPDGLTAESRDLLAWLEMWTAARMGLAESRVLVDFLTAIEAAARQPLVGAIESHVPNPGAHGDFVWCGCGWSSDDDGGMDWPQHVMAVGGEGV